MAWCTLRWAGAVLACAGAALVGWRLEDARAKRGLGPRPVHNLQRTASVLDAEDCAYLADFYRSNKASWTQTYFNMLVHRWNNRDERMGAIFDKVVRAANRVEGGCGDYTITNDFFSYRAPGVVQFALDGMFHMDCDFWKTPSSDGFNLWILIDHNGLDTSFDILERQRNEAIYKNYDSAKSSYLLAQNGSDPRSPYFVTSPRPLSFRRGHSDVLGWPSCLQAGFRQAMRSWVKKRAAGRRGRYNDTELAPSNLKLALGEAVVLREQELHRTDLHRQLGPGQFRLVAGFKMQRRNSTVEQFDMACTSQKDRFNILSLWERVGTPLQQVYSVDPGSKLVYMAFPGKVSALLAANSYSLSAVAVAGVAARAWGSSTPHTLFLTVSAATVILAPVVYVQLDWFRSTAENLAGEGSRLRSAVM